MEPSYGSTRSGPRSAAGCVDDAAFDGDPGAIYGRLVEMGASLIQTDRPELLLRYLRAWVSMTKVSRK